MHIYKRYAVILLLLLPAVVLFAIGPAAADPEAPAGGPSPRATPKSLYVSPNERIGVGLVRTIADITSYDVAQLEAGWYADWGARLNPPRPNGMDYMPIIPARKSQFPPNWALLAEQVRRNPGSVWAIGNEPEAVFQENLTPAEYVPIYHEIYTFIKRIDPTAQVAIGGVILPSPLRLQWLDMVLNEYQARYGVPMPVDVWNIHTQIVNEVSCDYDPGNCWGAEIPAGVSANYGITMTLADNANVDLFVRLVRAMRVWMHARGLRNKPLIISEYGVLLPSDYLCDDCSIHKEKGDQIVASFMTRTFEYLLTATDPTIGYPADGNRLVQRWMWYTLNDQPYNFETGEGFNGGLFDWRNTTYPGTLTYFGRAFRDYVAPLKVPYRDLKPISVTVILTDGVCTTTATIANVGNAAASNVVVRAYAGDPAVGGHQVGSDVIIPSVGIRYTTPAKATFVFAHTPGQPRAYYVVVDPSNTIVESNEENNKISYLVGTYPYTIMLPIIVGTY